MLNVNKYNNNKSANSDQFEIKKVKVFFITHTILFGESLRKNMKYIRDNVTSIGR